MGSEMRKFMGFIAAMAVAVVAVLGWANLSIRADAALGTAGPMVTDAQIDPIELTATVGRLPAQAFIAF